MADQTSEANVLERFLNELDTLPWFEHVGDRIADPNIKQVFSWEDAWDACQDDPWIYASFHKDVDQSHPAWAPAFDRALQAIVKSGRDHELEDDVNVSNQAAWDTAGAAYQLATNKPDGFYPRLMDWYRKGHWPCGWDGTYPEGRLIVY
ncbi:MAG TPA: hypothetical protein VNG71_10475 [Pyrinomonadaceae bacterium]|nr:hypothetical protein [Pyrinomonadaceae bacterium]